MSLYMESTTISPERTAGEIQELLVSAGAKRIMTEHKDKQIRGLSFTLDVRGQEVPFCLPARVEPVFRYLQKQRSERSLRIPRLVWTSGLPLFG